MRIYKKIELLRALKENKIDKKFKRSKTKNKIKERD